MQIHRVEKPFLSFVGQFEEGERSLSIGLDVLALNKTDYYRCYLGNSQDRYYEIKSSEALEYATMVGSFWTNKKGKKVAILPLSIFKISGNFEHTELPKREKKPAETVANQQQVLL